MNSNATSSQAAFVSSVGAVVTLFYANEFQLTRFLLFDSSSGPDVIDGHWFEFC